ncbi:MAG: tetratricopeptide repeat protein [Nitrospirota bacterium]|nr:tetratricopeptide repeat protein [Nitrospirota bacterium]
MNIINIILFLLSLLILHTPSYGEENATLPNLVESHIETCRERYGKGNFAEAISACTKALEIDPQLTTAYYIRGNVRLAQGDIDRAIEEYSKAIKLDSKYVIAYNGRGVAWYSKGEYGQAIDDFLKAIEINQNYDQALNNLAWLYATCPVAKFINGKKAIKLAEKAISLGEMNDTFLAIVYYKTLAAAQAQNGGFKTAVKTEADVAAWLEYDGYTDMLTESKLRLKKYKSKQQWRTKETIIIKDMSGAGLIIYREPIL